MWMGVEGIFSGCWYLIFRFLGGIVVQSVKFRYIVLTFVSEYDTILVTRGCGRILAVGFEGGVIFAVLSERGCIFAVLYLKHEISAIEFRERCGASLTGLG